MKTKRSTNLIVNTFILAILVFVILVYSALLFWNKGGALVRVSTVVTDTVYQHSKYLQDLKPIDDVIPDSISYRKYKILEDSITTLRKLRNGDGMNMGSAVSLGFIGTYTASCCDTCRIKYDNNSLPHFATYNLPTQSYIVLPGWKIKQPTAKFYNDTLTFYVNHRQSYLRRMAEDNKHDYTGGTYSNRHAIDVAVPFRYNRAGNYVMIPVKKSTEKAVNIILTIGSILVLLCYLHFIIAGFVKFLIDVSRGRIFTVENIQRLKVIGVSLTILPFALIFLDLTMMLVFRNYFDNHLTLTVENWTGWWVTLLIGIVFLLLYRAFRSGKKIKDEQDLVI